MNPYKNMELPELHKLKKETIAKSREAKKQKNKSHAMKLKNDIGMIKQAIAKGMEKKSLVEAEVDPERQKIVAIKEENNQANLSKFGFVITSHALKRYKLRFDPNVMMADLYDLMVKTDVVKYIGILGSGQFPVKDNCVAVIKNKKILTFKNTQSDV